MPYRWLKAGLYVLLVWNTAVYAWSGTASEALDSSAWLVLLVSFELETRLRARHDARRLTVFARACRLLAAAALVAATAGYVREGEWLDAVNMGLWVAVVALLELEVRRPAAAARWRPVLLAVAAMLYSGLAALVLAWAWRGEWFDAYDALLWLAAFATIEMNLLKPDSRDVTRADAG
jgi:hypothetical protein